MTHGYILQKYLEKAEFESAKKYIETEGLDNESVLDIIDLAKDVIREKHVHEFESRIENLNEFKKNYEPDRDSFLETLLMEDSNLCDETI